MRILACDLSALDAAQRARHSALRAELRARRLDAREVADGPFFDFALDIAAGAAQARLTIGGDADVKAFLKAQQG